jgi:glycolate oxidase
VVTADGEIAWFGGRVGEGPGYDLRGLFIGSEGTLGMVTKVIVRLLPLPASVVTMLGTFETIEQASGAVSGIIGAGLVPAAIEMMDGLTIQAVEASIKAGYPPDAGAVLLIELDGLPGVVETQATAARAACLEHGARDVRIASDAAERATLWRGRKEAIGSLGHIAPNYYIVDGVVPRSKLVDVMQAVSDVSAASGFRIANVFHAGDGNLHPLILFDEREPGATARVLDAAGAVMRSCVDAGGSLTGEHGIGFEKQRYMPWLYSETDLENMGRVRGTFGNEGEFNPCKLLPAGTGCGEMAHQESAIRAAGPDAYV